MSTDLYKCHYFPDEIEIINPCAWFYYHFDLSFPAVEELLFEHGIKLRYDALLSKNESKLKERNRPNLEH